MTPLQEHIGVGDTYHGVGQGPGGDALRWEGPRPRLWLVNEGPLLGEAEWEGRVEDMDALGVRGRVRWRGPLEG